MSLLPGRPGWPAVQAEIAEALTFRAAVNLRVQMASPKPRTLLCIGNAAAGGSGGWSEKSA